MNYDDLTPEKISEIRLQCIRFAIDLQRCIPKGFLDITKTAADWEKYVINGIKDDGTKEDSK